MLQQQMTDKLAGTAAVAAPIIAAGATLSDVAQIAQICAYFGSFAAGVGAAIYYLVKIRRKQ